MSLKPHTVEEGEEQYFPSWTTLPDALTIHIFSFLRASSLYNASLVCKSWFSVAYDELLWKELFHRRWEISRTAPLSPGRQSWVEEYKRLLYHTPVVESEVLTEHTDEVLHVSFSHNGKMFATCSRDGFIMVWNAGYPTCLKYKTKLESVCGDYPRFSQFHSNDTRLLVSCRQGYSTLTLVIFDLTDDLKTLRIVNNHPLKAFGSWYDDNNIITFEQEYVFRNNIYVSQVDSTCCSDGPGEINKVFVSPLNACTFGMIVVAEDTTPDENKDSTQNTQKVLDGKAETTSSNRTFGLDTHISREGDSVVNISQSCDSDVTDRFVLAGSIKHSSDPKWIIFATGAKAERDGPNRIQIMSIRSPKSLTEGQQPAFSGICDSTSGNSLLVKLDNLFNVDGQIFGICCSPDQRFLYVSTQSWRRSGELRTGPGTPGEMVIQVIDLQKMQKMDIVFHTDCKPTLHWFYIYIDVSDDYLASGSERTNGYLWDRHYGICLQKYQHDVVVNAVAFNPTDPEMLVTVSDDRSIKIWRSLNRQKEIRKYNEGKVETPDRIIPKEFE